LFTQFYSYFNMQANLVSTEFQRIAQGIGVKQGRGQLLYLYTFGFMVPAVVSALIARTLGGGWDEDDESGLWDDFMAVFFGSQAKTLTAMVPGGKIAELAGTKVFNTATGKKSFGGYDDRLSMSPAVSSIESAAGAFGSVPDALFGTGSKRKAVKDGLTLLGLISGLPLAPLAKPIGYGLDVMDGKVDPSGPVDAIRGLATGKSGTKK
ncbi:MAG: hypothetical protein H0U59_06720, partial [Gemmatimonadaceae bacterium]|nr:hypothetical protein [Gemmatimonadaceae bacterium]